MYQFFVDNKELLFIISPTKFSFQNFSRRTLGKDSTNSISEGVLKAPNSALQNDNNSFFFHGTVFSEENERLYDFSIIGIGFSNSSCFFNRRVSLKCFINLAREILIPPLIIRSFFLST